MTCNGNPADAMSRAAPGTNVVIRRRWNESVTARVSVDALRDFHIRNEPGGVCGALPRGFLSARIWCDSLTRGELGHSCQEGTAPHDLLVCILPNDNPEALYAQLRATTRR